MMDSRLRYSGIGDVLKEWRTRAVTIVLYIAIAVALPAYVASVIQSISTGRWQLAVVMTAVYIAIIVVAILKRLDYRVRGWVFVAVGYLMAVTNLATFGPGGLRACLSDGYAYYCVYTCRDPCRLDNHGSQCPYLRRLQFAGQ